MWLSGHDTEATPGSRAESSSKRLQGFGTGTEHIENNERSML
jgi:hypothetical protein